MVKAFIRLKEGVVASEELKKEIQEFVKGKLSKHEYSRELEFIAELPKTPDGKIKRKVLKEMKMERAKRNFNYHAKPPAMPGRVEKAML